MKHYYSVHVWIDAHVFNAANVRLLVVVEVGKLHFFEIFDDGFSIMSHYETFQDDHLSTSFFWVLIVIHLYIDLDRGALISQQVYRSIFVVWLDFDSSLSDCVFAKMDTFAQPNASALCCHFQRLL